jgi:hypothetical protein
MIIPRILRLLRIAVSAVCLVVCGLLITLWVRSSYLGDTFELRTPFVQVTVNSARSLVGTGIGFKTGHTYDRAIWWGTFPHERIGNLDDFASRRFRILAVRDGFIAQAPHWFLVLITIAFAVLSWIRWRFSLRTLLLATTLVAVVLGLAVAMK